MTTVLKEGGLPQGSPLCYAWGKVRMHNSLILCDSSSTHNYISVGLASKLGIHAHEMGETHAVEGPATPVTPLIGKLRLYVQGYVDKEDFLVSALKNEDVFLGTPWFHRMAASINKFPERELPLELKRIKVSTSTTAVGLFPLSTPSHPRFVSNNLSSRRI
ncbi:hypothetical protein L7F22_051013 [Adiantum nelumboides]|nr:hypothetical protein [Adiantum nelumboides]